MIADPETFASIKRQVAEVLTKHFDHVDYDESGTFLLVQDGLWFEFTPSQVDNGEAE